MTFYEKLCGRGPYIIAEMSSNHAGSLENALKIVRAAKEAGADGLKLQTYTADTMTINCSRDCFRIKGGLWDGRLLYELYKEASTPWEWHGVIRDECIKLGLDFFSTPYDRSAVDFLDALNVPCFKIASFELVDLPLIEYAASKGKPLLLSCGMASLKEIGEALRAAYGSGNHEVVLLKCCSEYPARYDDSNLAAIPELRKAFSLPVGFSDHTPGSIADVVAVSLGACAIEKHLCLSRDIDSADKAFSLEPGEFRKMVKNVRTATEIIGGKAGGTSALEKESMPLRRSVFAVKDIKAGELLTGENIRVIRPGCGMKPKYYSHALGKRALRDIERGEPIDFGLFEPG
ncbi:pseudaminic acid synthase [Caproicibacter sp.]|uniref:pseudaminic acid synthase n=1 Tax=Caproicibacter sp. TaxID=2814884 RepID=UPI0039897F72